MFGRLRGCDSFWELRGCDSEALRRNRCFGKLRGCDSEALRRNRCLEVERVRFFASLLLCDFARNSLCPLCLEWFVKKGCWEVGGVRYLFLCVLCVWSGSLKKMLGSWGECDHST